MIVAAVSLRTIIVEAEVSVGHAVPVHWKTGSLVHAGVLVQIDVVPVATFSTEITDADSAGTGNGERAYACLPCALRKIKVCVVRNILVRNINQSSPVMGSVGGEIQCHVIRADDVDTELKLQSTVAENRGVLLESLTA